MCFYPLSSVEYWRPQLKQSSGLDLERLLMMRSVLMLQLTKSFHLVPQNTALVHGKNAFPCFPGNGTMVRGTMATGNYGDVEIRAEAGARALQPAVQCSSPRLRGLCQRDTRTRRHPLSPITDYDTDPADLTGQHLLSSPQQLNFLTPENQT